jgi:thiol-disulfide isomerase/thioredoxin
MKTTFKIACFAALWLWASACGEQKPSDSTSRVVATATTPSANNTNPPAPANAAMTIKGNIKNAQASKVFLDRKMPDAHDVITSVPLNEDGTFEIKANLPEAGIYRLRVGLASLPLILAGTEDATVSAELDGENVSKFELQGAPLSAELPKWFPPKKSEAESLRAHFNNMPSDNPFLNLYLVERLDINQNFEIYKAVLEQMTKTYSNSALTLALNAKVSMMVTAKSAGQIAEGVLAPDIRLPNPDGKEISLSSLKGKIVLLDFWASWCGPCRRENPSVVKLYQQYKDKGFTVYSVSLDGLDNNTLMRLQNNTTEIKNATDAQRKKWLDAIKTDNLIWENHVSDLRGWSSVAAAMYGVNSIPRTFLLDKSGKIVGMNLRGDQLEQKVKSLLK